MAIAQPVHPPLALADGSDAPPLRNGDRLDRPTFHARYERMPEGFRAELIGGIVYVPSPVLRPHALTCALVNTWLGVYSARTPGSEALAAGTHLLGPESEPEPDACLRILPACGGRYRNEAGYVAGPVELVAEVSWSTESIDMHLKKDDYERAGVQEYLVVLLQRAEIRWFALEGGAYEPLAADDDGAFRSRVFPGLLLDPAALLENRPASLLAALEAGLASPEHAAFVTGMAQRSAAAEG